MLTRMRFAAVMLALAFVLSPGNGAWSQAPSKPLREVKFSLDFIPLGRFAGFYVALGKGYFADEGLNVSIISGKGSADGIRMIETGISDIGFVDIPSIAVTNGTTSVTVVSVIYQKAPYCIFSLDPGANVVKPQDMVGLELGSSTASFIPKIHQAFMKMHGLDPSTLKVVNVEPSARVPMLLSDKVPSVDLYVMSRPGIEANANGKRVKCLLLADFGLDLYGSGIGARKDFIERNPAVVKGIVKASMRGLKDALANPEEAAKIQMQYIKTLNPQVVAEELKIVRDLAVVPDTKTHGLGWFEPTRMKKSFDFMAQFATDAAAAKAPQLFQTDFLPNPPVLP